MNHTLDSIKKRMKALEALIEETKKRLPAHSIKPPVMEELLQYEDEYHLLMNRLQELASAKPSDK